MCTFKLQRLRSTILSVGPNLDWKISGRRRSLQELYMSARLQVETYGITCEVK